MLLQAATIVGTVGASAWAAFMAFVPGAKKPPAPPPPTPVNKTPVTLELHHRWDEPGAEPILQRQVRAFRDLYPHVAVNTTLDQRPGDTPAIQSTRLNSAISAGSAPDLFMVHTSDAIHLADRGALAYLDQNIQTDKIDTRDVWFPAALRMVYRSNIQASGSVRTPSPGTFALPQTAAGDGPFLFYNRSMLRSAGIEPATLRTWDGLLAASKALAKPLGDVFIEVGFPYPGGHFPTWVLVSGGGLLSEDGRRPTFNTMPVRQALSYLVDATLTVYRSAGRVSTFFSQQPSTCGAGAQGVRGWCGNMDTAFAEHRMGMWLSGP